MACVSHLQWVSYMYTENLTRVLKVKGGKQGGTRTTTMSSLRSQWEWRRAEGGRSIRGTEQQLDSSMLQGFAAITRSIPQRQANNRSIKRYKGRVEDGRGIVNIRLAALILEAARIL